MRRWLRRWRDMRRVRSRRWRYVRAGENLLRIPARGVQVIEGELPAGYVPPSASLEPERRSTMAQPARRIQRKRTRDWRMPDGAVYVGRPSKWGNPWSVGDGFEVTRQPAVDPARNNGRVIGPAEFVVSAFVETPEQAVDLYRAAWVLPSNEDEVRAELAGRDLVCWCPLDSPCHGDVLLEIANLKVAPPKETPDGTC